MENEFITLIVPGEARRAALLRCYSLACERARTLRVGVTVGNVPALGDETRPPTGDTLTNAANAEKECR